MPVTPTEDLQDLYELDFGHSAESIIRILATFAGSMLLSALTDSSIFIAWFFAYAIGYGIYYLLFKHFLKNPSVHALPIILFFFGLLTAMFVVVPAVLIVSQDLVLQLGGFGFFAAMLIYLSRRNDTYLPVILIQMVSVYAVSLGMTFNAFGHLTNPWAIGAVGIGIFSFLLYYTQSLFVARSIKLQSRSMLRVASDAQKMAAVGQLAGGVAHDFNNVLAAILGNVELYDQTQDKDEQNRIVKEISKAADHGAQTISQLMIFTRQAHKKVTVVNLAQLVNETSDLALRLLPKGVALSQHIEDTEPSIRVDERQAKTALINLLTNALDAMPNGGRVLFSCHWETIKSPKPLVGGDELAPGKYLAISLTDTGDGIPRDIVDRVHEPFFTTKPVGKGTGLGLPAVLGFIKEFGKGLHIENLEMGTKVTLYFTPAT